MWIMWISFCKNSMPDLARIYDSCLKRVSKFKLLLNLRTEIGIKIYCTKISPLLEYASPVWGGSPKYLAEELQSIQNRCLDITRIPRTSPPTLEARCKVATKRELRRIVNDFNHPNQIFFTKPNTSHGYNLRSRPGSVAIPKSGTRRHTNSF